MLIDPSIAPFLFVIFAWRKPEVGERRLERNRGFSFPFGHKINLTVATIEFDPAIFQISPMFFWLCSIR